MRLHSYVVDHDMGFAPNPFHGVCTLACCKPRVRKYAKLGEYVIGVGTKKRKLGSRLIYLMKISDITDFDRYWKDPRFRKKRAVPNGSWMQRYGDNIYHRDLKTQFWVQENSFHSKKDGITDPDNLRVDTGTTDRVLVGDWFVYWGEKAPEIPKRFDQFVHKGIGNHYVDDHQAIEKFVDWALSKGEPGVLGDPVEWKYLEKKFERERRHKLKKAA
jgi:hypothetical protein